MNRNKLPDKMTHKKVYIISTSEDGLIGVFTNKKRLFECMEWLMDNGWETGKIFRSTNDQPKPTYANVCKELKEHSFLTIYTDDHCSMDIETRYTNKF